MPRTIQRFHGYEQRDTVVVSWRKGYPLKSQEVWKVEQKEGLVVGRDWTTLTTLPRELPCWEGHSWKSVFWRQDCGGGRFHGWKPWYTRVATPPLFTTCYKSCTWNSCGRRRVQFFHVCGREDLRTPLQFGERSQGKTETLVSGISGSCWASTDPWIGVQGQLLKN